MIRQKIEDIYRAESRKVLATLIRLLGDFDLAEEALQDAFTAALNQWEKDGIPANPSAWLISTGRFKAIDSIRQRYRHDAALQQIAIELESKLVTQPEAQLEAKAESGGFEDDRLKLIFTCCHPALPPEGRAALTLREVCGLTTEEIARAFLTSPATLAQRIVRAKAKIKEDRIPYQVPSGAELPERLDAVLQVIYLVFNEGYSASSGNSVTRPDLSGEAIRLGRLLLELLPEPEAGGLLALMLLHESRRAARTSPDGEIVLLEKQDRSLWNREQMAEGKKLVEQSLASRNFGPFTLQAAISAAHAESENPGATDWTKIIDYYDLLNRMTPSPVVELNRAVAVAMRDGPMIGLALIDSILANGELEDYHLLHSAKADFYRRMGRMDKAKASYEKALSLTQQEPEKRFLMRRLAEIGA